MEGFPLAPHFVPPAGFPKGPDHMDPSDFVRLLRDFLRCKVPRSTTLVSDREEKRSAALAG